MTEVGLRITDSPNTLAPVPAGTPDDTIRLSQILAVARRRRWAILVPVAIWLVVGLVYLVTTPRSYVASATLLLDAGTNPVVEELAAMDEGGLSESAIENARLVIRSATLAARVVEDLALHRNEAFLDPPQSMVSRLVGAVKTVIRAPLNVIRGSAPPAPADSTADPEEAQRDRVARALSGEIGVERIGRSGAVSVYFGAHDPELAAEIVNAYAEAYITDVLNANMESTERTTEWMQARLANLEAAAAEAAAEAEAFRGENGLVSSDGRFMSEEAVRELNTDLSEAIGEAARSRAMVEGYQAAVALGITGLKSGAGIGTDTAADPELADLQAGLASAVANLNRITADFGSDHPQAALVEAEIEAWAERLLVALQQRLGQSRGELAVAEARVQALRDSVGQAMGDNAEAGSAQVELRALEQRAETLSLLYQTFLTRFQEIDQQRDFPISDVRILSTAEVPRSADGPRASRVLAASVVIGLFFGLALAMFREWGDRFLRTGDDAAEASGVPFLGYLPETGSEKPAPGPLARLDEAIQWMRQRIRRATGRPAAIVARRGAATSAENNSIYLETLQSVRLAMSASPMGDVRQVVSLRRAREAIPALPDRGILGVTSLRPGEGKSTVSMNLAATLAAGGASVLLVDADMRRPGLSRHLEIVDGASLVDVAVGRAAWDQTIRQGLLPGVDILPCIRPEGLGHVADLLAAGPIRGLFEQARQRYDHVVVDLAPLGPVVDARIVMRSLGRVILVAEWGATPKTMLRKAVAGDRILAKRLMGVVLNRVHMAALGDYVDRASEDAYLAEYGEYMRS